MRNEKSVFHSRRKTLEEQIELLSEGMQQAKMEVAGIVAQIAATEENIGYIKKQRVASESLVKNRFIQQSELWGIKRSEAHQKERRGGLITALAEARGKIADFKLKIIVLKNTYIQNAGNNFKEHKKQIYDIEERLRPAIKNSKDKPSRLQLLAR